MLEYRSILVSRYGYKKDKPAETEKENIGK